MIGINTATHTTEICIDNVCKSWQANYDEAEKLLPEISRLKQIKKIFVVTGPGSYTGLRIGVTAANTLAYLYNAPILGMNTFDFLRYRLPEELQKKTAVFISAGANAVAYTADFGEEPVIISGCLQTGPIKLPQQISHYYTDSNVEQTLQTLEGLQHSPLDSLQKIETLLPFGEFLQKVSKMATQTLVKPVYLRPPQITKPKQTT